MTSEQPEQGRWRVESNEFLVSPEDRVMAQRTETVSVLHDLAGELNALEAYKALAVRAYEMLDLIQTWPEDWSSEFIDDVTRWVDDYDALTPPEKGD